MNRLVAWIVLGASVSEFGQSPASPAAAEKSVMVAAVSRDGFLYVGGIGVACVMGRRKS